ncbi:SGNH/GDSL hydrolase family protein [Litoribaculum gwangyangense]|uniref:SGNH/GDSL hydrolase family protein n=1 Tax=Litoribaculum gwangyangense TaxID=1130722 RepID=A0ABP9CR22_9FLAO
MIVVGFQACSQNEIISLDDGQEVDLNALYPDNNVVISTHTEFTRTHYPIRIAEFKEHPLEFKDIVFLGNSITEQGGDWCLRLNNPRVKNRGIAGDTTDGVLARLEEIIYYEPQQVFILIGINDLFRDDMTAEKVFNNILKIVNKIKSGSKETNIFVQTVLPTSTLLLKEKIQQTNALLLEAEKNQPYQIIPLHNHFATSDDLMNMELSEDGVHLNENGYIRWVDNIINKVKK